MAAPSRSINYGSGAAIELDRNAYFDVIYSMKALPKELNQAIRTEARFIADDIVKPAVVGAILSHTGAVGPKLAQSVRTRGDRIPSVVIGKARTPFYSGHKGPNTKKASTNMLRYGSIVGVYRRATGSSDTSERFRSRGQEVTWPQNIVTPGWPTAAATKFYEPTFKAWQSMVYDFVDDFNSGRI